MRLIDHILPRAEDFRDFTPPDDPLPTQALRFIWIFVWALRISLGFKTICFMMGAGLFATEAYFYGRLVQALIESGHQDVWHRVLLIAIGYGGIQVFGRAAWQMGNAAGALNSPVLTMLIRRRLSSYVFTHSYRYFQDDFAGRLAGKVVEMPQAVREFVEDAMGTALPLLFNVGVVIALFTGIDWRFGLCVGLCLACSALLCRWAIPRVLAKSTDSSATRNEMRGRYLDGISNILLVKLFANEVHEDRLFSAAMIGTGTNEQIENKQGRVVARLQHLLNGSFQIGIFLLCIQLYAAGKIDTGAVATALTLCYSIALQLWTTLELSIRTIARLAMIGEGLASIVGPAEVYDAPDPVLLPAAADVTFDAITFGYPGHPVFDGFSLTIAPGQRVGLVGPSGAGKSTLVQLMLRLFDVQEGAIRIGGQDISEVAQGALRRSIAMIPQATDLMHRSIRDNIAYGNLEASEAQIVAAAKKAFIHNTILGLKDNHGNAGYDSLVGERGVKLSGGQRQRIAIARAFLKDAPILILDEATSALDSESERLIQESLDALFKGRTVIVIAHRLSTIAHLDRIVVMDQGRIVEDGAHSALVDAGGLYARLWQLQSAGFIGG